MGWARKIVILYVIVAPPVGCIDTVYHVTMLDHVRENMSHMKAIVFVRANAENLRLLRDELHTPKCSEYHLFFSNLLPPEFLERLAEADVHESVIQVQEYFADYYPVNQEFFSLNLGGSLSMQRPPENPLRPLTSSQAVFRRALDGLVGLLLSLRLKPLVRHQQTSPIAFDFAKAVKATMDRERGLFTFRSSPSSVLLVLDRKEDPVTPLLSQWTYQAMVHELLGIANNRVELQRSRRPGGRQETQEILLDPENDDFFHDHMFSNFGDFADAVHQRMEALQVSHHDRSRMDTIGATYPLLVICTGCSYFCSLVEEANFEASYNEVGAPCFFLCVQRIWFAWWRSFPS